MSLVFNNYKRKFNRYEKLTKQQQNDLYYAYKNGDKKAGDKLVLHTLRAILFTVKYSWEHDKIDDVMQEGTLGIIKALEKYDPKKGVSFNTYAQQWILAQVNMHYHKNKSVVSTTKTANNAQDVPMEYSVEDGHGEKEYILSDIIQSENIDIDHELDVVIDRSSISNKVNHALSFLSERDRCIIVKRYMMDKKITRNQIGKDMNLSRETIRLAEKSALGRLKKLMGAYYAN